MQVLSLKSADMQMDLVSQLTAFRNSLNKKLWQVNINGAENKIL